MKSFTFLRAKLVLEGVFSSLLANLLFIIKTAVKLYWLNLMVLLIIWIVNVNFIVKKLKICLTSLLVAKRNFLNLVVREVT